LRHTQSIFLTKKDDNWQKKSQTRKNLENIKFPDIAL